MTNLKVELNEAIDAAERALRCLNEAKASLNSASGWGLFDILGGGFIYSIVKHDKIGKAKNLIDEAKSSLVLLADELDDIDEINELDVQASSAIKAFDIVFDNFFSDFMVQNKIKESQVQLDRIINQVQKVRYRLIERRQSLDE